MISLRQNVASFLWLNMQLFGIDFTSAPRKGKPIVCAVGKISDDLLEICDIETWNDFTSYEQFLRRPGSWIAGFDLPFGQPAELVQALGWPEKWNDYVAFVGSIEKSEFVETVRQYSAAQPAGSKHLFRATDRWASACSPMMLYGVPVGKMFFEGATRLQRSELSICPCRPSDDNRTAIETYPALVARYLVGRNSYKASRASEDTASRLQTRIDIAQQLNSAKIRDRYGVRLKLPKSLRKQLIDDHSGDRLDAVLCCIQTAWAATKQTSGWGVPRHVAQNEGHIVDPQGLQSMGGH